jgi:hypothetical protein
MVDEYPNGHLYYYRDQGSELPDLWTLSGKELLIIAKCKEGDNRKTIFRKMVDWLCCMKQGDFDSLKTGNCPYYAVRIDPVTKSYQIAYYESGPWLKLINSDKIE